MDTNQLKGTGVALVTPFTSDSKVDFVGLEKLVNHVIEGGLDYLVVLGTTGETVTLTEQEQAQVTKKVVEVANNRLPVVLGMGGNNTSAIVEKMGNTNFTGISAILSASPSYNKPTQEGIYQHYRMLSENSPLPIILYNVPGRTASNMLASTTLRLANDFENIVAIKEASGNLEQVMEIIKDVPDGFQVISGDDALTLPIIACGGSGVISVVANAYPKEFSNMVNFCLDGNYAEARKIHYSLTETIRLLFVEGNPAGVKAVLKMKGIGGDVVRLPLVNIGTETHQKLQGEFEKL